MEFAPALLKHILTALCASIIVMVFRKAIEQAAIKAFSWIPIRKHVKLDGVWNSTWDVNSERFPEHVRSERTIVKQLGNRFYAKFAFEHVEYRVIGTIDAMRYVTGTWADSRKGGYHGAFQLFIDPHTRSMKGRWVGYSATGEVKQGLWEWQRQQSE